MLESFSDPQTWISLLTLVVLEIVLGIDNIVFISILAGRLPEPQAHKARQVGLAAAMITRILLLLTISWVIRLTAPLFSIFEMEISGRDLIMLAGGLFLIYKSTHEIHNKLEGEEEHRTVKAAPSFNSVIIQIATLDIVFSLDSVITAVGMASHLWVMIAAVIIAVGVMMWSSDGISAFVNQHPTVKMLALSFLLLIGFSLVVEAFEVHIPKGYIYFAMGFSIFVEMLNLRVRTKRDPVQLRQTLPKGTKETGKA
jgi:predicted tellurium resistance membrane protein TerC